MTESLFTRKLLAKLRPRVEDELGGVLFKHNDFYTAGVPDFTITLGGRTTWWELKVHPNVPTKLQAFYLAKLRRSHVVTAHAAYPPHYILDDRYVATLDDLVTEIIAESLKET